MKIEFAHNRVQGINVAVFQADARSDLNTDRAGLLADLTAQIRRNGLRVDKAALAYTQHGRLQFFGTNDLVKYLSNGGFRALRWTHSLDI
jgi:hypothetical protein